MREVGNDALAAVTRIVADEVVVHAALRAKAADCAGLVEVEMWQAVEDAEAQHAAMLRVRLRRSKLEFGAVILQRDIRRLAAQWIHPVGSGRRRGAALKETASSPASLCVVHY